MSFFPSSVPTALQLLDARNNKSVTLSSAINDVVTTIPVTDTSDIPTAGYLTFEDGSNEVIQYTGVTPTSLTGVTRGADGTTASSHSNGGTIGMWGNAKYHNVLSEEMVAVTQNLSDRLGLSATQILAPLGSAAAPTYAFTGITNRGMYSVSTRIGFAVGGVQICRIGSDGFILDAGTFLGVAGSNTLPTYAFAADDNTGMYGNGAGRISFATDGTARVHIDNSGFMNILGLDLYLAASNRLFLDGGGDTYITESSANAIGFVTGGTLRVRFDSTSAYFSDGSANTPGLCFINDDNIGMFRIGADQLGFSTGGILRVTINNSGLTVNSGTLTATFTFADGTVGAPSFAFASQTNTGFYREQPDSFSATTNGVRVASFYNINSVDKGILAVIGGFISGVDGAAAQPAFRWDADSDTGIYRASANVLAFATGGVQCGYFTTSVFSIGSTIHIENSDGSAAAPAYSFFNDPDTGFFRQGSGEVRYSDNGNTRMQWGTDIRAHVVMIPAVDNTLAFGASGQRWTTIFATNGTINTSHSSTKQNIVEIDPLSVEVPRAVLYDRDGRRHMGYLNDSLPDVARPYENGQIVKEMNYENAVIGVLCAHVRKLEAELADLKSNIN